MIPEESGKSECMESSHSENDGSNVDELSGNTSGNGNGKHKKNKKKSKPHVYVMKSLKSSLNKGIMAKVEKQQNTKQAKFQDVALKASTRRKSIIDRQNTVKQSLTGVEVGS